MHIAGPNDTNAGGKDALHAIYPKFATWLGSSCSKYNQERGRNVPFSGVETVNKILATLF